MGSLLNNLTVTIANIPKLILGKSSQDILQVELGYSFGVKELLFPGNWNRPARISAFSTLLTICETVDSCTSQLCPM
jgi:hypothetical protein